jgi:hypothetical protein
MAISGVANSDVETIAKTLGVARRGTYGVAALLNGFAYQTMTATPSDIGSHTLRLTVANLQGVVVVDWGDGTTTQVGANAGATIDHIYAASGTKTYDITASAFHKRGTQAIA